MRSHSSQNCLWWLLWAGDVSFGKSQNFSRHLHHQMSFCPVEVHALPHVLDQMVVAPCRDSTVRFWKQDWDACKNVSGLRCRAPECCIMRASSNPDSIILILADGDDGLLLWPLSLSNSPSVVSRRARRIPNQNSSINTIRLAAVAANLFVIYNDGSMNTFILHNGSNRAQCNTYTCLWNRPPLAKHQYHLHH